MKKITLSRESFLSASSKAITFIEDKVMVPIYACYLLQFDGLTLSITASRGGNHQIQTSCPATGDPFTACVNANILHGICSSLMETDLTFTFPESKGQLKHLHIVEKGKKHALPIFPSEEFNVVKAPEKLNILKVRASIFTKMIECAASLVDDKRNEMMPQWGGVNICTHPGHPGSIIMQGGVSHSFAVAEYPGSGVDKFEAVTVDKGCVEDMSDLIQDHEDVELWHDGQRLVISSASVTISTRLLTGKYPDMIGLVGKIKTAGRVRFNAGEMGYALKRLGFHKNKKEVNVIVISIPESGDMKVTLDNIDQGSVGDEEVIISGSPVAATLGFNIEFFNNGLRAAKAISVEMGYSDTKSPVLLTPTESEDNRWNATIVLAPCKING